MRKVILALVLVFVACSSSYSKEPSVIKPIPSELFGPVIVDPLPAQTQKAREQPSLKPPAPIVLVNPTTKPKKEEIKNYGPTVADAKRYALDVLGSTQYYCIDQIFIHESHWNPYDLNESSGAYGIPQALPGSKMAVIADDWRTNPITQVKWGIKYVNGRYGSACAAWDFWQRNRWY